MADISEAGLPIKSPGNTDDKTEVQLVDGSTPTQKTTVDSDGNAHVQVHGDNPAGGDEVLRMSELGHAAVDGVRDGTNNTDPSNIGIIAHVRATTPADANQTIRLTGKNGTTDTDRWALDVAISDENGNAFGSSNPLSVTVEESAGAEVHDFDEGTSIAAGATSNHDYSVANGDVFHLKRVIGSASGAGKYTLDIGDGAVSETFTTRAIMFASEAHQNVVFDFGGVPLKVTGTVNTTTVRIIRENRDDDTAQDMHSTVMGVTNP